MMIDVMARESNSESQVLRGRREGGGAVPARDLWDGRHPSWLTVAFQSPCDLLAEFLGGDPL